MPVHNRRRISSTQYTPSTNLYPQSPKRCPNTLTFTLSPIKDAINNIKCQTTKSSTSSNTSFDTINSCDCDSFHNDEDSFTIVSISGLSSIHHDAYNIDIECQYSYSDPELLHSEVVWRDKYRQEEDELQCPTARRRHARHTDSLVTHRLPRLNVGSSRTMTLMGKKMEDEKTSENKKTTRAVQRATYKDTAKYAAVAEREHWTRVIMERVVQYGPESVAVGRAMSDLGCAHMRCKDYAHALSVYKKAVHILRKNHGNNSLAVAHVLDKVGVAASFCPNSDTDGKTLDWALVALGESFHIRYHNLGPWHCDTADTLNNIAGVHMRKRELIEAKEVYKEVLTVRAAIFGNVHPSVAVTAQTLGTVHLWLSEFEHAFRHFNYALRLYRENMKLKETNPLVIKALKSVESTERVMISKGYI